MSGVNRYNKEKTHLGAVILNLVGMNVTATLSIWILISESK